MSKVPVAKIKVNVDFPEVGVRKGQMIEVPLSPGGKVRNVFWRRRLRDAAVDKCCEWVNKPKEEKPSKAAGNPDGKKE